MKHTRGPWQVEDLVENDYEPRHVKIMGPDGIKMIAKAFYGKTDEECACNAHLIAAAPDLLKSCKDILDCINSYNIIDQINTEDAKALSEAAAEVHISICKAEDKN